MYPAQEATQAQGTDASTIRFEYFEEDRAFVTIPDKVTVLELYQAYVSWVLHQNDEVFPEWTYVAPSDTCPLGELYVADWDIRVEEHGDLVGTEEIVGFEEPRCRLFMFADINRLFITNSINLLKFSHALARRDIQHSYDAQTKMLSLPGWEVIVSSDLTDPFQLGGGINSYASMTMRSPEVVEKMIQEHSALTEKQNTNNMENMDTTIDTALPYGDDSTGTDSIADIPQSTNPVNPVDVLSEEVIEPVNSQEQPVAVEPVVQQVDTNLVVAETANVSTPEVISIEQDADADAVFIPQTSSVAMNPSKMERKKGKQGRKNDQGAGQERKERDPRHKRERAPFNTSFKDKLQAAALAVPRATISTSLSERLRERAALVREEEDGVDFINVCGQAKTKLGAFLNPYSDNAFVHPDLGRFETVIGFTIFALMKGTPDNNLRTLSQTRLRHLLPQYKYEVFDGWQQLPAEALWIRVCSNPEMVAEIVKNQLPYRSSYHVAEGDTTRLTNESWWLLPAIEEIERVLKLRETMRIGGEDKETIDAVVPDFTFFTTDNRFHPIPGENSLYVYGHRYIRHRR